MTTTTEQIAQKFFTELAAIYPEPELEAHYTNGSKTRPAKLDLAQTIRGRRDWLSSQTVSGKAEARKLAKAAGATPWNF